MHPTPPFPNLFLLLYKLQLDFFFSFHKCFNFSEGGDGLVNDSSSLERHRKEILGTSIESFVNYPPNSIVNSCLPAVPSIDLGGGAASHSSDTIHVINSKTFSTPQSALRFSNIEQNGNETRFV